MAIYPQGQLTYGGVQAEGAFSVIRSGSGSPDPIIARFYLGTFLPPIGDVFLAYNGSILRMRNCRLAKSATTTRAGRMLEAQIEDRRWAWKFPKLYCRFNDEIDGTREYRKNFIEIVQYIVYRLLGELDADLSALSHVYSIFDTPVVLADGEPAIDVLEALLEERGLMIVLDLNDRMAIRIRGFGPPPPNDPLVIDQEYAFEPPIVPERLISLTAPITFEKDLRLRPVGLETDGSVKNIDQLSYKPPNGWEKEDPRFFPNVAADKRELAKRCIWRMYEARRPQALPVPEAYPFERNIFVNTTRESILPLRNVRANEKPAEVIGYFTDTKVTGKNNDLAPAEWDNTYYDTAFDSVDKGVGTGINSRLYYPDRFHLDVETGIVTFDRPVYYKKVTGGVIDANSIEAAKIVLRTSYNLRQENGQFVRQVYTYLPFLPYVVPGLVETIQDENQKYIVYPNPLRGSTSREQIESWGLRKSDERVRRYAIDQNCVTLCAGFRFDRSPDGRMYAVRFERSEEGESTTQLEWQTELTVERLSYAEKVERLRVEQRDRSVRREFLRLEAERKQRRLGRMQ